MALFLFCAENHGNESLNRSAHDSVDAPWNASSASCSRRFLFTSSSQWQHFQIPLCFFDEKAETAAKDNVRDSLHNSRRKTIKIEEKQRWRGTFAFLPFSSSFTTPTLRSPAMARLLSNTKKRPVSTLTEPISK